MSPYFNDKLSLFLTEVSFEASEENQLSYFQNGYFFKILWWSHEPHNKGICRWKNEIISECFTINNHGFSFVSFLIDQTLQALGIQVVSWMKSASKLPVCNWCLEVGKVCIHEILHSRAWYLQCRCFWIVFQVWHQM